jgi:hypothetical protein
MRFLNSRFLERAFQDALSDVRFARFLYETEKLGRFRWFETARLIARAILSAQKFSPNSRHE